MKKPRVIKVAELFAGVGGFRLGLEGDSKKQSATSGYKEPLSMTREYKVVWSNQYEPMTKVQHASMVYEARWPKSNHSSEDIFDVVTNKIETIPDHDLLVGGFPCQDYSVMTSLRRSSGLMGKKGVLWWSIEALLKKKGKNAPNFLLLENVDRLLTSPANQKGRDFAMILASLDKLGYAVEWRIINAADYGMPQRRRRVFIVAYRVGTTLYKELLKLDKKTGDYHFDWLHSKGVLGKTFPITTNYTRIKRVPKNDEHKLDIEGDFDAISSNFNRAGTKNSQPVFGNAGYMIQGRFYAGKVESQKEKPHPLRKILQTERQVLKEFPDVFINDGTPLKVPISLRGDKGVEINLFTEMDKWKFLKGAKRIPKINRNGYKYMYAEGKMSFPDPLSQPARTIITGEGGNSPSRTKHIVKVNNKYRRLTPIELERVNMFPDNHTKLDGIVDSKRAFFMGNALVVGVVERIGAELSIRIKPSELHSANK